jgi:hypothetical protein
MNIEETIHETALPVNTIAMANRLIEILKENRTNSAMDFRIKPEFSTRLLDSKGAARFRKCLWLINQQIFGQLTVIDMDKEWMLLNAIDTKD